jgi:Uma2 family endonuclease
MTDKIIPEISLSFDEFTRDYVGKRYEYVDGKPQPMGEEVIGENGVLTVSPTTGLHGLITNYIAFLLTGFVTTNRLGYVFGAETGFIMNHETSEMRAADVAFFAKGRITSLEQLKGWLPFPPNLAVEVISEHDRATDVQRKARSYIGNGTQLLWLIYPDTREIEVHRPNEPIYTLDADDVLDGGNVLPDFSVDVKRIFTITESE